MSDKEKKPIDHTPENAGPGWRLLEVNEVMLNFKYTHLPQFLQDISQPFADLAQRIADGPQNRETVKALDLLLAAKDAAVRAHVKH